MEHGALVRVTQQSRRGDVLGQFAYPLEKIFAASDPTSPWGPALRGGERSLVLVSDDNFADDAVTQFVALGIRSR
ncbi:hypothetical protein [Streptomyces sp. ITFR-6]|uniref:hypothetical protein n=1 Tax=Streptomyces sp. ITFR-6 TaxID=3075197 RepID=UPI0028890803|nr:hypothetical protein [Streptomyces sp. ITFR-6]WNI30658.1 hypothetical protein RLT59_19075 [Streptomyces sp. ITFR-6]